MKLPKPASTATAHFMRNLPAPTTPALARPFQSSSSKATRPTLSNGPAATRISASTSRNMSPQGHIAARHSSAIPTGTKLAVQEAQLPGVYTLLQSPEAREAHSRHQEDFAKAIQAWRATPEFAKALEERLAEICSAEGPQRIRDTFCGPLTRDDAIRTEADERLTDIGGATCDLLAQELPRLLDSIDFDASIYRPRDEADKHGYGRFLLHSDDHFCLQMFSFGKDQETPPHDHPNECASYIVKGALLETLFSNSESAVDVDGQRKVSVADVSERPTGSLAAFDKLHLNIPHVLAHNEGDYALSAHLYRGIDGLTQGQQVAALHKFGVLTKLANESETRDETPVKP